MPLHGTVMPAHVLSSDRALQVSIRIVYICIRMREDVLTDKELLLKVEQQESRIGKQDKRIAVVLNYLKKFIEFKDTPRKQIGFKGENER